MPNFMSKNVTLNICSNNLLGDTTYQVNLVSKAKKVALLICSSKVQMNLFQLNT